MRPDTIVAPATPPGRGGVSLIRISGSESNQIVKKITGLNSLKNRRSTLTSILSAGKTIDHVLIVFFKKPFSYTGEDVIEITCHGNPSVVDLILKTIIKVGARLADPGEFTKRAFINGKLDLVQAESVSALIGSRSEAAALMNQKTLSGALSSCIGNLRDTLISLLSRLEFELDVSEYENPEKTLPELLYKSLNNIKLDISGLISTFEEGRLYNNGARVVIFGAPNVGKSTLLNSLIRKDRAITSQTPGTTRDTIDTHIILEGVPVVLVDTAGIRASSGEIETKGIERSLDEIKSADLIIHVSTENLGFVLPVDYIEDTPQIKIINKVDLLKNPKETIGVFYISALHGDGVDTIRFEIPKILKKGFRPSSDIVLTTRRQVDALSRSNKSIGFALSQLNTSKPELEIIALEIRDSITELDRLLGKTTVDNILDQMFSDFCVGK